MKVIWDSSSKYSTFFNTTVGIVDLWSQRISSEPIGRQIGGVMMMVTDENFQFCDLELKFYGNEALSSFTPPAFLDKSEGIITTEVDIPSNVRSFIMSDAKTIIISIGEEEAVNWFQLDDGNILLGLSMNSYLSFIVCKNLIEDPDSIELSKWIEWIDENSGL